jgi:hypothetical protein
LTKYYSPITAATDRFRYSLSLLVRIRVRVEQTPFSISS